MPRADDECQDLLAFESLPVTVARLRLGLLPARPAPLVEHFRAAVADVKPELDLLHQHGRDGLIYRYPRVIYRVQGRVPTVVAVAEGTSILADLTLVGCDLRLGATVRRVTEATFEATEESLGPLRSPRPYRFATPWLALNQENHARFFRLDEEERRRFLDAQIANNCLSLAKSLNLRILTRIAARARLRPVRVRLKGVEMVGFLGRFEVNFSIPAGLGLGKSVSRGFGAMMRGF